MRKRNIFWVAVILCGCAALCWIGWTSLFGGRSLSPEAEAVMAEIGRLSDPAANRDVAEWSYGVRIADRILAVADARERRMLLEAFHDAVRNFPLDDPKWLRRLGRIGMYQRLIVGVSSGYCSSDVRKALDVRLEFFRTCLDELRATWTIYMDVEAGRRRMSRVEWRHFQEYAYKLADEYLAALYAFERWVAPSLRDRVSEDEWTAFKSDFRGVVGRELRTAAEAVRLNGERIERLPKRFWMDERIRLHMEACGVCGR